MADDLDELISLGNVQPVAKARGRPRRGARQQQQQQQQLVLADAEPEVQDLVELAAIAAAPPRRHEEQRSWQHAEQAGKTAKRLAAKAADADAKRRRSVRGDPHRGFDLSLGGHSSRPYCQVGPDGRSTEFGYLEIGCGTRLARCSLEVSGKFASSCCWVVVARHREIATVRDAASCQPSTPVEDEPLDSEINRTSRVARLAWQWDETYYELLECRGTSIVGSERARRTPFAPNHDAQGGHLRSWDVDEDELVPVSSDPMLARALSLESQSCDHLCEGSGYAYKSI